MKKQIAQLPHLGIILFLILYFYAASVYPGGNRFDNYALGYSHLKNYWCDLFYSTTYLGQPNPARVFALIGMALLPVTLLFFWYHVPVLFGNNRTRALIVRITGCLSMFLAAFLPLAHDELIHCCFFIGFVAFMTTLVSLYQNREYKLSLIALLSILLCIANYAIWRTSFLLEFLAIVQKMAFLLFFIWIVLSTHKYTNRLIQN